MAATILLEREGSPPPGLRLPQAKLSRNSNQIVRGRIRQFESYMPSQAVGLQQPNAARSIARPFAVSRVSVWASIQRWRDVYSVTFFRRGKAPDRQLGRAGDSLVIRQGQDIVAISTEQVRRLVQAIIQAARSSM